MKKVFEVTVGLILVMVMVSSPAVVAGGSMNIPVWSQPISTHAYAGGLNRSLHPDGELIEIAVQEGDLEKSPAIAYGEHFVLVYAQKGDILAKVSSDGRDWPAKYKVARLDESECDHPAIAYEAVSGGFIITYACSPGDVYAQAFFPATGLIGPRTSIADDAASAGSPAIACNALIGSCLIAYQTSSGEIKGRYLTIGNSGDLNLSPVYDLTDIEMASDPRLAWGRGSGAYLLTYTDTRYLDGSFAAYTHVREDHSTMAETRYLHSSVPVVPGGVASPGHETFAADVAYDPCTQKYLVIVNHDAVGDGGNFDLWAAILHPSDPLTVDHFPIAATPADERSGALRFLTADHLAPACGGMDRLVVVYIHTPLGVMAAELYGNSRPAQPGYALDPPSQHLLVQITADDNILSAPSISSGPGGMGMLIAYEVFWKPSHDVDIWGRWVALRAHTFLPLVLR